MSLGEPLLLAIETATAVTSVALLRSGRVLAEVSEPEGRPHAEVLLPAIDRALADAGAARDAIGAFAVSVGPGGWTGLRIGLATLKGLALGDDAPVAAVSSLAGLAWSVRRPAITLVPVLDARRGELYGAGFEFDGETLTPSVAEAVWQPAQLAAQLADQQADRQAGPCLLVGDGLALHGDALRSALAGPVEVASVRAQAAAIGALGARMLARGEGRPASEVLPRYLRRAEAEVVRTGRRFEADGAPDPAGKSF